MENPIFYSMLVGSPGAGKSSFINTLIKYVNTTKDAGQKLKSYLPTAKSEVMGGHTMTREPVKLMDDLIIVDNRGWHDWNNPAALKELSAQIRGNRSFDDDVIWDDDGSSSDEESGIPMAITEKVDCTTLVLNGIGGIDAVENITGLIETCRKNTKRSPSVVITHKDGISDEEVQKMIVFLENEQIDPAKIFVVKNVTPKDDSLEDETGSCISGFIGSCRDDGEAGATAHRRREITEVNREKKREKKKINRRQNEISDGQHKLTMAAITEANLREVSETESKKQMASMREDALRLDIDRAERLHDMSEANLKKMNELELTNKSEFQENKKKMAKMEEEALRQNINHAKKLHDTEETNLTKMKELELTNESDFLESKKQMAKMKEEALRHDIDHAKKLHDTTEENLKKMKELELTNESDFHENHKDAIKEFYEGQLRKIHNT